MVTSVGAERAKNVLASLLSIIPKNHTCGRRVSNDQRKVCIALLFSMGQQITLRSWRLFCLASVCQKIRVRPPGRHSWAHGGREDTGSSHHGFAKGNQSDCEDGKMLNRLARELWKLHP